ncbi:MAG: hypothetical protein U5R06_14395 [candidate division KSB1 bacterium]|nr:hypothetical protein [candidate division KSB1 bacterium]
MSKAKLEIQSVIVLLFALVVILAVLFQMQRILPQPPGILKRLPAGRRIAVVDSAYVNLPFRFLVHAPRSDWQIIPVDHDTLLAQTRADSGLYDEITWVAEMHPDSKRDSLRTRIGVIHVPEKPVLEYSITLLNDLLNRYETAQRARVLQRATPVSHTLAGSYFAVQFPDTEPAVWVVTCFQRSKSLYVVETRIADQAFASMRPLVVSLPKRFVAISDITLNTGK